LIEELQELWKGVITTYDVSTKDGNHTSNFEEYSWGKFMIFLLMDL
jgi:hypothetical protein